MHFLGIVPLRILFLASLAAAMVVSTPSDNAPEGLEYRPGGEPFVLNLQQAVRHSQRSDAGAAHVSINALLGCRTVPLESQTDRPRFEVHYENVDLDGETMVVTSARDTTWIPEDLPFGSDFGYEIEVTGAGEIMRIRRTGDRTLFPNARLYEERQNRFLAYLPQLFVHLPGHKGVHRNRWESSTIEEIVAAEGITALLRTTTIFRLDPNESVDGPVVRAHLEFEHEFAAADTAGASVGRLRGSTGSGTFAFDTRTGRTVHYAAQDSAAFEIFDGSGWIRAHRARDTQLLSSPAHLVTDPGPDTETSRPDERADGHPDALLIGSVRPGAPDGRLARFARR